MYEKAALETGTRNVYKFSDKSFSHNLQQFSTQCPIPSNETQQEQAQTSNPYVWIEFNDCNFLARNKAPPKWCKKLTRVSCMSAIGLNYKYFMKTLHFSILAARHSALEWLLLW